MELQNISEKHIIKNFHKKVIITKYTIMKQLLAFFLLFVAVVANAVTFDVDGLRYNVISMDERTVEVAIIPKSMLLKPNGM